MKKIKLKSAIKAGWKVYPLYGIQPVALYGVPWKPTF